MSPFPDPREATSAEATPRQATVGYLVRDLFFEVRVTETLKRLNLAACSMARATPDHAPAPLDLLMVDLSTPPERWEPLIQSAHAAGCPVLAFGSHMDQARWQRARAAGATRIVANSQLVERMSELIGKLLQDQAGSSTTTAQGGT